MVAQRVGILVGSAAKGWIPNDAITTMLGFSLIKFMPMIMSLTIFIAVLLTLTRWHRDSEMVIWFSTGLSITKWIKPTMQFALPVVVIISLLSFFVMPWATNKIEDYRVELKSRDEVSAISPGVFKESNSGDRVYFVEELGDLGNVVKNVFVQTTQHQKTGVIVAQEGSRFKAKNDDNFLLLEKGRRYASKPGSAEISITEFEQYAIRTETKEVARKPSDSNMLTTNILLKSDNLKDRAELQWRLAIPVSTVILLLLAITLSFVDPRAGRSLNLMFALFVFIIYNNMLNIFQAWIEQDRINVHLGLWPVHGLFLLLSIYLFYRRLYLLPIIPAFLKPSWIARKLNRVNA